jgi:ankyrin repeat protein
VHGADVEETGEFELKALHQACETGRLEIARLLLDEGANVNAKTGNNGWTPLHVACNSNQLQIVNLLIGKRARVEDMDDLGKIPLHLACERNHVELVWTMIQQCPWLMFG